MKLNNARMQWKSNFKELLIITAFALLGAMGLVAIALVTTASAAIEPPAATVNKKEQVFQLQSTGEVGHLQIRLIENANRTVRGSIWSIQSRSRTILANCVEEKVERFFLPSSHPKLVHFECTDATLGTMRMPLIIVWDKADSPLAVRASFGSALFGRKVEGSLLKKLL